MFLSIITPTYNRAYTLGRLYASLLEQTEFDFEWIVVNDGSTDETDKLIESFIDDGKVRISYVIQNNGGKQRAHNKGVSLAQGELTVCVDSDDALSADAVEVIKRVWTSAAGEGNIGILAKRGDFDKHNPICADWPDSLTECTMMELQEEYGFTGDTVLFFRTELLKNKPFISFQGEKFVPEDSLYADLDEFGSMILLKRVLYYCEYLPDGLTSSYRQLLLKNPMGTAYCYYRRMLRSGRMRSRIKNAIISQAFLIQSKRKAEFECTEKKICYTIGALCAPVYRWLKKMK